MVDSLTVAKEARVSPLMSTVVVVAADATLGVTMVAAARINIATTPELRRSNLREYTLHDPVIRDHLDVDDPLLSLCISPTPLAPRTMPRVPVNAPCPRERFRSP